MDQQIILALDNIEPNSIDFFLPIIVYLLMVLVTINFISRVKTLLELMVVVLCPLTILIFLCIFK